MRHPHHTRTVPSEAFTSVLRFRGGDRVPVHASSTSGVVGLRVRHAVTGDVVWSADGVGVGDEVCEAPGDPGGLAWMLFGETEPATVARLAHGHSVLGCCTRGRGSVVHAGSSDWAQGLGRGPLGARITRNVIGPLS